MHQLALPYTAEVFFAAMENYNRAWFPAPLVGALLALAALALALRPPAGRETAAARLIGAILGGAWLWVGAVHQLRHMATLNFLAPVYGWGWIAEGSLILLVVALVGGLRFRFGGDVRGRVGLALAVAGLAGYPLAVLLLGYGWRSLPLAGTAPEPTAIFTAGLLLGMRGRPPLRLFALPLGWSAVAGISAYLLDFPLDYAVPAAVIAALVLVAAERIRKPGRTKQTSGGPQAPDS